MKGFILRVKKDMARKANVKMARRFFPGSTGKAKKIDTVRAQRDGNGAFRSAPEVLAEACNAWTALDGFRRMAQRNKRFVFGDQLGDYVQTECGRMTERQSIVKQGATPHQNNRLRGIVRSVTGIFQQQQTEPVCIARDRDEQQLGETMSQALQYVYQLNRLWGLDGNNLQYFLISGVSAFRSYFGWKNGKADVWTDIVNPNHFFFDPHMQDPRHTDCYLVGQIYDTGLHDVQAMFSNGDRRRARQIAELYGNIDRETVQSVMWDSLIDDRKQFLDFLIPDEPVSRCRVIEVWRKESKERLLVHDTLTGDYYKTELSDEAVLEAENVRRAMELAAAGAAPEDLRPITWEWFVDNYWYYYFLTPLGTVLQEGETPYRHESHPFTFRIYPFYDSRVFPFVSDFIDQQKYINSLIQLQEFIVRASAKGVLMVHEDSIPDGMSPSDFADNWARYNGQIVYTGKPGVPPPQQIVGSAQHLGVSEMLNIQLRLLEDISTVQGALQGKSPAAGTPAALYMQQTQNATTSLVELFEAYRELREERDMKNMKLIQQYYTEPRYINISGRAATNAAVFYDPAKVNNAEFDLAIVESASTPAYRMITNEWLMQLYQLDKQGRITVDDLLEMGSFPFADKLRQTLAARDEKMAQGQQQTGTPGMPAAGEF
jgi:hypothetical protein